MKVKKIELTNEIPVAELYELSDGSISKTTLSKEFKLCDNLSVNNIVKDDINKDYKIVNSEVKSIMKHKVSKEKYTITDECDNSIIVTGDHSIMVLRDNKLISVKAKDILINDKMIVINNDSVYISDIKSIIQNENFDNEYVYDIEMKDKSHTFIANNILVHNSAYSQLDEVIASTDWMSHPVWRLTTTNKENASQKSIYVSSSLYPTQEDAEKYFNTSELDPQKTSYVIDQIEPNGREFALTLDRVFLNKFFKDIFDSYSSDRYCKNYLNFELESYADSGIWLAKKKYVQNILWTDPDVYYDNLTYIKPKGIELAQSSSSKWIRSKMEYLIRWIFSQEEFNFNAYVKELSAIKKELMVRNIEDISISKGMNKYDEYVINDTNKIELRQKAMVTIQGAALYNYMLNNNKALKKKYTSLTDTKKLNMVYIKPNNRFTMLQQQSDGSFKQEQCKSLSFIAGDVPIEILTQFEVDRNKMFELLILQPMNRIIESMGYKPLDSSLMYSTSIFDF